jgi:hypothetical protein
VKDGLEALFDALRPLLKRPFAGTLTEDQPLPDADTGSHRVLKVIQRGKCVSSGEVRDTQVIEVMERETRLELATPTLARSCSTN